MKNILKKERHGYAIALTLLSSLALLAAPAVASADGQRSIVVTASGEVSSSPDMAVLRLGAINHSDSVQKALNENNKTINEVVDAFKKNGIAGKDIQTSGLSVYPIHQDEQEKQTSDKLYQVSNTLTIRIHDLGKAGQFFDQAVKLGINSVDNISFTNADQKPIYQKARKQAVIEAIDKAATLAEAAHLKLGPILEIREESNNGGFRSTPVLLSTRASNNNPSNFESGELSYRVHVSVTFAIEQ
ncbi:SIMPL domain-containing protein [Bartonella sp. DGB2]|uniref:SIMPL domain-containing protein n=1 Tax=Bartonella sp. DGB2 TaxID=3388426 RepID=UPI00398FAD3D